MSDPNLQNFIDLSAALTGLSAKLLAPSVDPINLPPLFFATAQQGMGTVAFSNLLELYASIKNQPLAQIASAVLDNSDPQIAQGGRSIMKLWLLGSWYQPYDQGNATRVIPVWSPTRPTRKAGRGRSSSPTPWATASITSATGPSSHRPSSNLPVSTPRKGSSHEQSTNPEHRNRRCDRRGRRHGRQRHGLSIGLGRFESAGARVGPGDSA